MPIGEAGTIEDMGAKCVNYQIVAEDHGRKPVGESVPLKQMKEIV